MREGACLLIAVFGWSLGKKNVRDTPRDMPTPPPPSPYVAELPIPVLVPRCRSAC